MVECKFCGNEYKQLAEQCPTCGGRSFRNKNDALMTVQYGAMGYGMMMSQPCVVQVVSGTSDGETRLPKNSAGKIAWSKIQPGSYSESVLFEKMKLGSVSLDQIDFNQ